MKKILITWHFSSHGIGYLKNILGAFFTGKVKEEKSGLKSALLDQIEMDSVFDGAPKHNGIYFDKVYYLTVAQEKWDQVATRHNSTKKRLKDDPLLKENKIMQEAWSTICGGELTNLATDRAFIQKHYPDQSEIFESLLWRTIHQYPIKDQINWFQNSSNAASIYGERLQVVEMDLPQYGLTDLRNPVSTTKALKNLIFELSDKQTGSEFNVIPSLSIFPIQLSWYLLAESNYLPSNTRFFQSYDRKDTTFSTVRFRDFYVEQVPISILSSVRDMISPYEAPQSKARELANQKMAVFIKAGFAILILGERGTGKSRLAQKYKGSKEHFAVANCGAFDNDLRAEEELFGYLVKYKRTSRAREVTEEKRDGLFHKAHGGVLFLDDIHYLSSQVQSKLMRALETDSDNHFRVRRIGSTEENLIQCKVIMASNRSLSELKLALLPDFYDRIVQNVILLPSLAESPQDRLADWDGIWRQMKFNTPTPTKPEVKRWLKAQHFPGNYRDLQKFAIYYHNYDQLFSQETKKLSGHKSAFEYAKSEFEMFHHPLGATAYFNFSEKKNAKQMVMEYQNDLANWALAVYGNAQDASMQLDISERTLYTWKKEIS